MERFPTILAPSAPATSAPPLPTSLAQPAAPEPLATRRWSSENRRALRAWQPRFLLVDDEPVVRETLAPYLAGRLRVAMHTAASGEEALELCRRASFDIVLSDHTMSGMSGLDLLRRLRHDMPRAARVMVSGAVDPDLREAAQRDGLVHAFVAKPYSLLRMEKLLRRMADDARVAHGPGNVARAPAQWRTL